MITDEQLKAVGTFLKPHGIEGEITLQRDYDDIDFEDFSCLIVDMDGIYVPFFIDGVRPKGSDTDLVSIDGIGDETHAALLTNKTAYVLRSELAEARRRMAEQEEDGEDEDGFYAEDFVGFSVETDSYTILARGTSRTLNRFSGITSFFLSEKIRRIIPQIIFLIWNLTNRKRLSISTGD